MATSESKKDSIIVGWKNYPQCKARADKKARITRGELKEWLENSDAYNDSIIELARYRLLHRFLSISTTASGFSSVAMCSLLIETFSCYWFGLPRTDKVKVWSSLYSTTTSLKDAVERANKRMSGSNLPVNGLGLGLGLGGSLFYWFFNEFEFAPVKNGRSFYSDIRCGLLHQGETKGNWLISRTSYPTDTTPPKVISAPDLVTHLSEQVKGYLELVRTDLKRREALIDKLWFVWWHAGNGGECDEE